MKVKEVMTRDVAIASPDDSLREAAILMAHLDAGSLPVGEDDRLVGMLTDRDITVRAVAEGLAPDECWVGDIMSQDIKYIFEDETLEDAARNMAGLQVRRLPVLNRDKRLVGVVALGDLAMRETPAAGNALHGVSRR